MSIDFAELGATVAIGTYFLVGLELILFFIYDKSFWLPLPKLKEEKHSAVENAPNAAGDAPEQNGSKSVFEAGTALVVAICFILGLLVEDISYKFADKAQLQGWWLLPSEDDMRAATLFGDNWKDCFPTELETSGLNERCKGAIARFSPEPLAVQLTQLGLLGRFGGESGRKLIPLIKKSHDSYRDWNHVTQHDFIGAADSLYYQAKNTVYKEPNYYQEMNRIRMRIDFCFFSQTSG